MLWIIPGMTEPMRLGRDERQELVGYLSGEGLSTRAIAPIVGVSERTAAYDVEKTRVQDCTPAPEQTPDLIADPITGEVIEDAVIVEEPRKITGLDGKTYSPTAPKKPNRREVVMPMPVPSPFRGSSAEPPTGGHRTGV